MLIYAQDRKSVVDASTLQIQRNLGGGKEAKYCIAAYRSGLGEPVLAAVFPDEKIAIDALEKAYNAFADGAGAYKFD